MQPEIRDFNAEDYVSAYGGCDCIGCLLRLFLYLLDAQRAFLASFLPALDRRRRAWRIHFSLAGIGLSHRTVRLYLYEAHETQADAVAAFNDIPTEVAPTTGFRPARPARSLPTPGDASVGLAYLNGSGTLGYLVEDPTGDRYLLSNNHVVADLNRAPIGSPIIQPPNFDGCVTPRADIARLLQLSSRSTSPARTGSMPRSAPSRTSRSPRRVR